MAIAHRSSCSLLFSAYETGDSRAVYCVRVANYLMLDVENPLAHFVEKFYLRAPSVQVSPLLFSPLTALPARALIYPLLSSRRCVCRDGCSIWSVGSSSRSTTCRTASSSFSAASSPRTRTPFAHVMSSHVSSPVLPADATPARLSLFDFDADTPRLPLSLHCSFIHMIFPDSEQHTFPFLVP